MKYEEIKRTTRRAVRFTVLMGAIAVLIFIYGHYNNPNPYIAVPVVMFFSLSVCISVIELWFARKRLGKKSTTAKSR